MNRIITATALALALCAPAHAGDELSDSGARAAAELSASIARGDADMAELHGRPVPTAADAGNVLKTIP